MESPFRFLTNLSINLHAVGPAAVICVWLVAVTLVSIFGQGEIARSGMMALLFAGGVTLAGLVSKS